MLAERPFWYHHNVTIAGVGDSLPQQRIRIIGDPASFFMRGYQVWGGSGGAEWRGRRDATTYFQSDFVPILNILDNGGVGIPEYVPVTPEVEFKNNDAFLYDIRGVNNDVNGRFDTVLCGVKKYSWDSPLAPQYPDSWTPSRYTLSVPISIGAGQFIPEVEIRVQFRSTAFAVRELWWTFDPTVSAAPPDFCEITLKDHNHNAFMNEPVPVQSIFRIGNTERPGPLAAEMVIPAGRAFYLDLLGSNPAEIGGPWNLVLGFGGVLLNA
jgi:hypothetical protein